MLRKGMFLADRYEILEQIGTGGMSDVYKAKCHKLNRFVAIKVLKTEFSEDKNFVSKFRAEAQSAAGLTHPNIVNVYDVGDEDGVYYIVMELVEGITLKRYIEKKGKIPYKEAVSIAIQVANGMEAAHKHHIVHRDIKPQNIIISKEGKVKVTDFGIAKAASSSTINSSVAMGSVHYISPEQARGGYSDERSDVYSFGITLFEMLTGTVPFDGDTTVSVAVQHIQDAIPAPSTVTENIPISIDKIVLKCTQKKTERRYQQVSELIADLKKSLVMPDEDFVKMIPVYAGSTAPADKDAQLNAGRTSENMKNISLEDEDDILEDDLEDDFDDDLEDDFDDDPPKKKKPDILDDIDDDDIDDESNDKLDQIMKWIGVGIVALILIITIFIVVKLVGGTSGKEEKPTATTQEETTKTQQTTADTTEKVKVPDVIGKTEEEAKAMLNQMGLGYKPSYQPSATVAKGTVIAQGTKKDTMVAKNTTITLTISTGPESTAVTNVVGQSLIDASNALEAAGFKVAVKREYSSTVDKDKVISQSPTGNVTPGVTVTIVVSDGPEPKKMVTVPNVVNKPESEALQMLRENGLEGKVVSRPTTATTVPYGNVIHQGYVGGEQVAEGTVIELTVSAYQKQEEPTTPAGTGGGNGTGNGNGNGSGTGNGGAGTGTDTDNGTGTGTGTGSAAANN